MVRAPDDVFTCKISARMTFDKSAICDHSVFPDIVNDVGVGIGIGLCVTRP